MKPRPGNGLRPWSTPVLFEARDGAITVSPVSPRGAAIRELYAHEAVLYEPDAIATGHAGIDQAVNALLSRLPPGFAFTATGPAVGHHGVGRLFWRAGPPDGPVMVTGTDVAHFEDGRIQTLHVFLDPAGV